MTHSDKKKHCRKRRATRSRTARPVGRFECLEERQLLTGILVSVGQMGGGLMIGGTTGNDQVEVRDGPGNTVRVQQLNSNRVVIKSWTMPRPTQIVFCGQSGNDYFANLTSLPSTALGGKGDDTLMGGSGRDIFDGGEGTDWLFGGKGADRIYGGPGHDYIRGGPGKDVLYSHGHKDASNLFGYYSKPAKAYAPPGSPSDQDTLLGDEDNDTLYGADDHECLDGGDGDDHLYGYDGSDRLFGGKGIDRIWAGHGNDTLQGGPDNDWLFGEYGYDWIYGNEGHDILVGGDQDDHLFGGAGQDWLMGGAGNDTLNGGVKGSQDTDGYVDFVYGEQGSDHFVLPAVEPDTTHTRVDGVAVEDATDFDPQNDTAEFRATHWKLDLNDGLLELPLPGGSVSRK